MFLYILVHRQNSLDGVLDVNELLFLPGRLTISIAAPMK